MIEHILYLSPDSNLVKTWLNSELEKDKIIINAVKDSNIESPVLISATTVAAKGRALICVPTVNPSIKVPTPQPSKNKKKPNSHIGNAGE